MNVLSKRSRSAPVVFAAAVLLLLIINIFHSYYVSQYRTMYDNPIYRWRISVAVALSELRDQPLSGYVAYRSISDYLNEHGLALMADEASPMPSYESVKELVRDPDRLEKLFQEASSVPIDYSLPPVLIAGSEKGEAAFYYWAFRLFGIHLTSLWIFYFVLLSASVLAFIFAFWRSPLCMLLLMIYLIGHNYMIGYASTGYFQTVHNSRFFPALALLPSMHLLLLVLRRERLSVAAIIPAMGQTFLLFFMIFCRIQAAWQPMAIIAVTLLVLPYRQLRPAAWRLWALEDAAGRAIVAGWPAALVIVGWLGLVAYQDIAIDRKAYMTETKIHTLWDPLLSGTISANSELTALYGLGEEPYSDTMGYMIALQYMRAHNDTMSPIAEVRDGVISINAMKNMGEYDRIMKRAFFQVVQRHPWLVLKSFVFDKPYDQISMLSHAKVFRPASFLWSLLLAVGSGLLLLRMAGAHQVRREHFVTAAWVVPLIGFLSLSTTFILPSPMIPDTILFFLMLILIIAACACASLVNEQWLKQRIDAARAKNYLP